MTGAATHPQVLDDDVTPDVIADLTARALSTGWRRDSVCGQYRGLGGNIWYPEDKHWRIEYREQVAMAVKLCEVCPVMDLCRALALHNREESGIWGGLDEKTRDDVLQQGEAATRALLLEAVEHTAALAQGKHEPWETHAA